MNKQDVNEQNVAESKNFTFVEYCDYLKEKQKEPYEKHTPLEKFFIELAKETGKHEGSVRRWYYGTAKPGKLEKQATAKLLKSDVETLWPAVTC